jgi:hypothetical protein
LGEQDLCGGWMDGRDGIASLKSWICVALVAFALREFRTSYLLCSIEVVRSLLFVGVM